MPARGLENQVMAGWQRDEAGIICGCVMGQRGQRVEKQPQSMYKRGLFSRSELPRRIYSFPVRVSLTYLAISAYSLITLIEGPAMSPPKDTCRVIDLTDSDQEDIDVEGGVTTVSSIARPSNLGVYIPKCFCLASQIPLTIS